MRSRILPALSALALATVLVAPAHAVIPVGQTANPFTKSALVGSSVGPAISLSDYAGRVKILFLLGYNCGACEREAPSVEAELWQFYQTHAPGQVTVVGADVYNGTPAQLAGFRNTTGVTFPLLLNANSDIGGNLFTDYTDRDDYVVLDQNDVVRFNARLQGYVWGASLDVPRIRTLVDSLLENTTAVAGTAPRARFEAAPSPFATMTRLTFAAPGTSGTLRVEVLDLAGRRVRTLFDGAASAGPLRLEWDGRDGEGYSTPAGVYLARAVSSSGVWTKRLVRLR